MRYLGAIALDSYQLLSRTPIAGVADLDGKKVGAVGLNQTWIRNTGAAPVSITAVSAYNDLQTGVIDAIILTPSLMRSSRIYEVAKNLTLVDFGAVFQLALAVNLDRWEALPDPVQQAIIKAADDWRLETVKRLSVAYRESIELMEENGVAIAPLTPEARVEWAERLPNVAKDWADGDPTRLKVLSAYVGALTAGGTTLPRDWLSE